MKSSGKNYGNSKVPKGFKYSIWAGVVVIVALISYALMLQNSEKNAEPGQYDTFAKCISEKGAFMYGTDWCVHCQNQKKMFGKSFDFVNFVNCDKNSNACSAQGVTGYPTWIFADGSRVSGTQQFDELSQKTGCAIQ
jgi:glutaredoxin